MPTFSPAVLQGSFVNIDISVSAAAVWAAAASVAWPTASSAVNVSASDTLVLDVAAPVSFSAGVMTEYSQLFAADSVTILVRRVAWVKNKIAIGDNNNGRPKRVAQL